MNRSCVQLKNLPDELLMFIFKQLNNVEILYSLFGVDERLDSILQDSLFTSHLNFVKWSPKKFLNIFSPDILFERFCSQILPAVREKIQRLDAESSAMKQILYAADYPNLHGLGLFNIEQETIENLFTDGSLSSGLFSNQITQLLITIDTDRNTKHCSTMKYIINHVFHVFQKLTHLIFFESSHQNIVELPYIHPPNNFSSSTLLVLNIKVDSFYSCLCLVDGRFSQLHTLIVESSILFSGGKIANQGDIPNLKCFSLACFVPIDCYDELIIPCLYRMSNLQILNLSLSIKVKETFIDGHHLKKKIVSHMSRLNQFTFDIHSIMKINNETVLPSKDDIHGTFNDMRPTQIICYMDHFRDKNEYRCHAYTYPSSMSFYPDISNQFPGGYYPYVRVVSLYDEWPFEHEFFLRIAQSFPLMEKLALTNRPMQFERLRRSYQSMDDICHLSVVEYAHLIELDIERIYDDSYVAEFLCDRKTCFRKNIHLRVSSDALLRVTNYFTRQDTRINCTKVDYLCPWGEWRYSQSFREYFPSINQIYYISPFYK